MIPLVSPYHPVKLVSSKYPPSLFKVDTSKIIPRYTLNFYEMFFWFSIFLFGENNDMPPDLRNAWDVIIPNPLKIVEAFENTLDKDIAVKGDAVFNLYFISNNIHRDKVKVGIYSWNNFIFPHEIKNKTVFIKYNPISRISRQRVRLKEVNCTLHPGDALLFLVEIIPSNKTITKILERRLDLDKLFDRWRDKIQRWEDSNLPLLIRLANLLNFTILMFNEFNLSERDVVEILNDLISSSIVYDSIFHPSSVTLHLMLPIWREYMDKDYVSKDLA